MKIKPSAISDPVGDGEVLVILLHGYTQSAKNLESVAER